MANEDAVDIIGGLSADHPAGDLLPVLASPSTAGKGKNTIRMELVPVGCWKLEDVRFAFASSFLLPETKKEFDELAALLKKHPKAPLTVFGHADPVGDDVFNKQLSGNRAESVYAVLIRDVARWEQLRKAGVIPDFREPDSIRLGLSPLTTSFSDVWNAMDTLRSFVS